MTLQAVRKLSYDSGPNMTPLVDVVMVILIFLMLAGAFVGNVLPAPSALGGDSKPGPVPIYISIDKGSAGEMMLVLGDRQVAGELNLKSRLVTMKELLNGAGRKTEEIPVLISPGRVISYDMLVKVNDILKQVGFSKIGVAKAH